MDKPEPTTQTSDPPSIRSSDASTVAPTGGIVEGPGSIIGPYKLLQQLGEGGFGVVYMAEQTQPVRRKVAIKIIKPGMDTKAVIARFEAERQALAMMDHPNIARVLDGGATPTGRPYFVMELVKGLPITKYCEQEHMDLRERMKLFIPVCQAVQHAHQKGIIHRDLKPANILIAMYDGQPVVKVIDFGVAKAMSQPLTDSTLFTQVGQMIGTLEYMAPEQAEMNNLDIDTRADIYSLGVILYELMTGSTPFSGKELKLAGYEKMLRIIREEEPEKPSTRISHTGETPHVAGSRKLEPVKMSKLLVHEPDWIVMKCIEKERVRRYETANALAMDIGRYLNDEPILAGPPSRAYRVAKYTRKYRRQIVAAAAFAALLIAATVTSITLAARARVAESKAQALAQAESEQRTLAETNATKAQESAEAEKAQRQLAESREKEARAILDYFEKYVLAAGRPKGLDGGLGKDALLRQAVDEAERSIPNSFADQPLVEAALRHTLGVTYGYLGEYETAKRQLDRAAQIRKDRLGPDHRDTLRSEFQATLSLRQLGRQQEAESKMEEIYRRQVESLGPDDPDTLSSQRNHAVTLYNNGRIEEALAMLEEVYRKRVAILGPDHRDTLDSLLYLAKSYQFTGNNDRAYELASEGLRRIESLHGKDYQESYRFMELLAWAERDRQRFDESTRLFESLLHRARVTLGDEHPSTLDYMSGLAWSYAARGRSLVALHVVTRVREVQRRTLEPDNYSALRTEADVAIGYAATGRDEEALRTIRAAHEKARALFAPDHMGRVEFDGRLAEVLFLLERYEEALPLYEASCRFVSEKMGERHGTTLTTRVLYAQLLSLLGRHAEAIPMLEELLPLFREVFGEDHPSVRELRHGMAFALARAGRVEEAIARARALFDAGKKEYPDLEAFAAVHAIAAGKTEGDAASAYADEAMRLLLQSEAAGLRDYSKLKYNDPDCASLRGREDFQQLVGRLEEKDKADLEAFLQSDLNAPVQP